MIETEITKRVEEERNFSALIDLKAKQLLNKYVVLYLNNLNKMKEKIAEFDRRWELLIEKSNNFKIEIDTLVDQNKEQLKNKSIEFKLLMKMRYDKQKEEADKEIVYIDKLRENFAKMKEEFIAKRDEAYKSLKRKIKNDLNEGKVYDEIAKVKALLSRQINELKALCKTEFNSREKSDTEILVSIEKWSQFFSEKTPQIIN